MSRSVPQWVAKHDDEAIPARVKVRVFDACGKKCQRCERSLYGRDTPQYDHVVAIANGGAHAENNLQVLCSWCHKLKTKADVREKAKIARLRKRHFGIKKPRSFTRWRNMRGELVIAGRER